MKPRTFTVIVDTAATGHAPEDVLRALGKAAGGFYQCPHHGAHREPCPCGAGWWIPTVDRAAYERWFARLDLDRDDRLVRVLARGLRWCADTLARLARKG